MRARLRRLVRLRTRQRDLAVADHAAMQAGRRRAESIAAELAREADALAGTEVAASQLESLGLSATQADAELAQAGARMENSRLRLRQAAAALQRAEKLKAAADVEAERAAAKAEERERDDRRTARS